MFRPLINLKQQLCCQIQGAVATISKGSIRAFMASSPFQRSFYETFYKGRPFNNNNKEHSITREPATVCDALVLPLVLQICGQMQVPMDILDSIISKLSGRLQTALKGRDIPVSTSSRYILSTVRAVHAELCEKMNKNVIIVNMLVLQEKLCRTIVDTLVKHLMKPRKKGVNFRTAYTSIVQFLRSYKELEDDYTI